MVKVNPFRSHQMVFTHGKPLPLNGSDVEVHIQSLTLIASYEGTTAALRRYVPSAVEGTIRTVHGLTLSYHANPSTYS